jgi:hypothetical protein
LVGSVTTAFVDRWRPETHNFHLPCGEMSVLMEDVAHILLLRLDGPVVSGTINTENWKDLVYQFTSRYHSEPEEGKKEKKTIGVSSNWLHQRFNRCPQNAADDVVERYARVWLWHMVACFLLPDTSRNTVSWMVIPQLSEA